jgi:hypothetical protein
MRNLFYTLMISAFASCGSAPQPSTESTTAPATPKLQPIPTQLLDTNLLSQFEQSKIQLENVTEYGKNTVYVRESGGHDNMLSVSGTTADSGHIVLELQDKDSSGNYSESEIVRVRRNFGGNMDGHGVIPGNHSMFEWENNAFQLGNRYSVYEIQEQRYVEMINYGGSYSGWLGGGKLKPKKGKFISQLMAIEPLY